MIVSLPFSFVQEKCVEQKKLENYEIMRDDEGKRRKSGGKKERKKRNRGERSNKERSDSCCVSEFIDSIGGVAPRYHNTKRLFVRG